MKRNIWNIIGMLASIGAIIVGVVLLNETTGHIPYVKEIAFGGDFYTEIYSVTRQIYNMLSHINQLIDSLNLIFGCAFIFAGIVSFCAFGNKLSNGKESVPSVPVETDELPDL